jgi:hypothetical protein
MGEAKKRGTYEQRRAAAQPRPERQPTQYKPRLAYTNKPLDYLWRQFIVGPNGETVGELQAALVKAKKEIENATV